MVGARVQIANERGEIVRVRGERILLARSEPRARAEVALGQRDIPVIAGDRLTLALPGSVVDRRAVYEYHRGALPLFDIVQRDAIYTRLPNCRRHDGPP